MSISSNIHGLIPIFNWSWWQVFLFAFIADWGVMQILHHYERSTAFQRPPWNSARYGDLFLPIGIASSILVLHNFHNFNSWYSSLLWGWIILISGLTINVTVEWLVLYKRLGKYTRKQLLSPGNIWHTIIFTILFYLSVFSLPMLFIVHRPTWAFITAIFGYAVWTAMLVYDIGHPNGFIRRKT